MNKPELQAATEVVSGSLNSSLSRFKEAVSKAAAKATLLGAGTAAFLLLSSSAAQALTWKWSAVFDNGHKAEGIFDTGLGLPSTGSLYTISGISGTYTTNLNTYQITGLSNYLGATNQFKWSGEGSPILSDIAGIAFTTMDGMIPGPIVSLYSVAWSSSDPEVFLPIDEWITDQASVSFAGSIKQSSLIPEVPGPLPILGASAGFAWSRRLRRRVTTARNTAPGAAE